MTTKSKPPAQTRAEIAAEFERQCEATHTFKRQLAVRETERQPLLLTDDDSAIESFDDETAAIKLRLDRAAARIVMLRKDHRAAADREMEAQRVALFENAERLRKRGGASFESAERHLRAAIADLAVVFEADLAIAMSTANLPQNTTALRPVESDYRWIDAEPVEIKQIDERHQVYVGGRSASQPEPLYVALEIPGLRAGEQPLRVPGATLSTLHGKALQPVPDLPADIKQIDDAPPKAASVIGIAVHRTTPDYVPDRAIRVVG